MKITYASVNEVLEKMVLPLIYKKLKRSKYHWYITYAGLLSSSGTYFVILHNGEKYRVFTYDKVNQRLEVSPGRFKVTVEKTTDEISISCFLGTFIFALKKTGQTRFCYGGEVSRIELILNQLC